VSDHADQDPTVARLAAEVERLNQAAVLMESEMDALVAERDEARKLLHGLTNEADANSAWKALILRAEAAEARVARLGADMEWLQFALSSWAVFREAQMGAVIFSGEMKDILARIDAALASGSEDSPLPERYALTEMAWVLIANAWEGDWTKAPQEWQDAAAKWRDEYHSSLRLASGSEGGEGA